MHPIARIAAPYRIVLIAALAAAMVWTVLRLAIPDTLDRAEELAGDTVWRLAAGLQGAAREQRILLVDIDERTLANVGAWPWPRERLAALSDRLASEGVALQVFDIVFSEAPNDTLLAARLAANRAVVAQVFALEPGAGPETGQPAAPLDWPACPPHFPEATGHVAGAPAYQALPTGHITPRVERDGVIRRQPAIVCRDGKAYPALFLAALAQAAQTREIKLDLPAGLSAPAGVLRGLAGSPSGIPLDPRGDVRVPWTLPPDRFISLSAADVLAGRVPGGILNNAWVVVGSTALGLNDRIATPFGGSGAGLLVHAQLLKGVLDDQIPATPRNNGLIAFALAGLGILLLAIVARQRPRSIALVPLVAGLLVVGLWSLKAVLLVKAALWIPWVAPATGITLFAVAHGLAGYARTRFDRERVFRHLSSYLPEPVAAALAEQDPSDAIDARRCTISVLFADIRNFSAYGETRPAEEATAVLHAFYAMVTRVVEAHDGIIETFQGDAVLAVWGSGNGDPAPEKALAAALDMLRQSRHTLPVPAEGDLAALELGIGLETGLATVGSFGLARRRTHLAIGRTVTTAARLQEMTVELAHPILIGEGMAAGIGPNRLESQGVFLLQGLQAPCHLYAYPLKDCVA